MNLKAIWEGILNLKTVVKEVPSEKVLVAATDYAAEDVLSESVSTGIAYMFEGMAKKRGGSGTIERAQVFCSTTGLTPRITLYLFTHVPSTNLNDNVANAAPSIADWPIFQGQIDFPALEDLGGGSTALVTESTVGNLALPYKCVSARLYGIAVLRDAVTGEGAGMVLGFKLLVRQD